MSQRARVIPSWLVVAAALTAAAAAPARADDGPSREYQVKAAFVFNFAMFTEWPASAFDAADAPLVIATVGDDPFRGALEQVCQGKTAGPRPIVVRHFASPGDIGGCQLLFVPASSDPDLSAIFKKLGAAPVLTVGETDAFPWAGGVMRFYLDDNKVRFEVNVDAAQKAGLRVSAKLMKLARIFKG